MRPSSVPNDLALVAGWWSRLCSGSSWQHDNAGMTVSCRTPLRQSPQSKISYPGRVPGVRNLPGYIIVRDLSLTFHQHASLLLASLFPSQYTGDCTYNVCLLYRRSFWVPWSLGIRLLCLRSRPTIVCVTNKPALSQFSRVHCMFCSSLDPQGNIFGNWI